MCAAQGQLHGSQNLALHLLPCSRGVLKWGSGGPCKELLLSTHIEVAMLQSRARGSACQCVPWFCATSLRQSAWPLCCTTHLQAVCGSPMHEHTMTHDIC